MSKPLNGISYIMNKKGLKQFLSYLLVGGAATLVEWFFFYILTRPFSLDQNLAFTIAFIISTAVNQLLGRLLTFKHSELKRKTKSKKLNLVKETSLIYFVAIIGYLMNLGILDALTYLLSMNSMIAKMIATAIVFFWNFFSRKLGIYKDMQDKPSVTQP